MFGLKKYKEKRGEERKRKEKNKRKINFVSNQ